MYMYFLDTQVALFHWNYFSEICFRVKRLQKAAFDPKTSSESRICNDAEKIFADFFNGIQ